MKDTPPAPAWSLALVVPIGLLVALFRLLRTGKPYDDSSPEDGVDGYAEATQEARKKAEAGG